MCYKAVQSPSVLLCVESPWAVHFEEHHLVKEAIAKDEFWLLRADLCTAACQNLDDPVHIERKGHIQYKVKLS